MIGFRIGFVRSAVDRQPPPVVVICSEKMRHFVVVGVLLHCEYDAEVSLG